MCIFNTHRFVVPFVFFLSFMAHADGGVVLGGTRLIYPDKQKESSISAQNTSKSTRYMVQSWVEDRDGKKTDDFIVTPPVYVSNPSSENNVRIILTRENLPDDRESLYYLTSKAIPAIDKNATNGKNFLVLAAATRIKLFVRPAGLQPSPSEASQKLTFVHNNRHVTIENPTPYYITLINIRVDGKKLDKSIMVSPFDKASLEVPFSTVKTINYQSINDYGGLDKPVAWTF